MNAKRNPTPTTVFGRRLRQVRELKGLPQERVGVLIGLDEHPGGVRISRYEGGVHEPPIATAQRIAKVLDTPLAYFYCADDVLAKIILLANALDDAGRESVLKSLKKKVSLEADSTIRQLTEK